MRRRSFVFIVILGLAAVVMASVLSMQPSLSDARDAIDSQWGQVQPQLDQRYDRLASLSRAVRAQRADLALLDDVDVALGDWEARSSRRPTPDPRQEAEVANRVESDGARLARSVTASPGLTASADVVLALRDFLTSDPKILLEPYNESVERYDRARSRFPGAFFASLLGFPAVGTVEVPGAYADIPVPAEPTTTTTTTLAEGVPTTTTTAP